MTCEFQRQSNKFNQRTVSNWEAEKSYPEMDKLLKLCQIFECTLDDLVQGDLTGRAPEPKAASVPAGPPTDICGYDEHQRMMAWKIPTGVAAILVGIAIGLFFEGAVDLASVGARDGLFVIIVLAGILVGLAFLVPAGMDHSAFIKAHPFVEDFYTEDDRLGARKSFTVGLIMGIALIFVGIGCLVMLEEMATENVALFFLLFFIALGVWNIIHYGMLLGRTDVAEYNRSVAEDLEVEDIVSAQLDDERREALLASKRADQKIGAVCGAIMIVATIIAFVLLFAPVLSSPDPDAFEPLGTSSAWFWAAWPIGGMICGIVTILMKAFGKQG
ncbi:helix-turn-helix transcriptional regulator [Collinsella tanakaei]|nr:helix-turn-helix transcriptional regulator [Collinsella tanakaei]